ncbi:DNA ligase 1 [Capsicum annuum]|uniref:DNA ligase n=1 Tax=Capsicum annuum TaxID=4072 RepID=A0A1U8EV20_CAPAN|nr:DNA ligase 1 [Capsicum annuum]KAF3614036.1 DNA ligase 1 [Capsicum annuum]KAF3638292.1 DNA ligase 1 [Capsicum annuum]PHT69218.1 DNA ligase 1 [Capsicum annuum]
MLSLRSCRYYKPLNPLYNHLNFTLKPSSISLLKPLFFSLNPKSTTMSSSSPPHPPPPPRSAFAVLMANSKKKTPSQDSSPKKRKTPHVESSSKSSEVNQGSVLKPIKDTHLDNLSKSEELVVGKEGNQDSVLKPAEDTLLDKDSKNEALVKKKGNQDSVLKPIEDTQMVNESKNEVLVEKKRNKDSVMKSIEGTQMVNESKSGELVAKKKRKMISPEESIVEIKKKAANFDPRKAAYWGDGERVPFMFVVKAFDAISKESGRIVITEIATNMLRTVIETTPEDLLPVVYLSANKIAAAHDGLELGVGDASIIKALAEACGAKEAHIKKQYKELGDLGLVAKASRSSQPLMHKPEALTVAKVFDKFRIIAKESGKDSQEKKKNYIKSLLVAATDCEPQYLIRLLQTKLRIGLAEQTLLVALAHAFVYSDKHSSPPAGVDSPLEEAAKIVKQVYSVIPVYEKIVPALLADGVWKLSETCSFSPGVPVGPMLAKPTKGVSEILDKFQDMEFTCEYKYDGERAQIHYMEDGSVEIYSRNAERNTGKFPDVVAAISRLKKSSAASFVLDCELVAYDREKQKILPFQVLSTRARKNVVISEIKVNVCIYAFDILYLNGQPLLQEQLNVRREHLYKSFEEEPGYFQFATAVASNDLEEITKFLEDAVNGSCEGLIIKTLTTDATYEPSKRSNNWLKLKKDYMESIGDSLDLVPIAAFHGRGKRTGVYGAFLLACYDNNNEEYQSICKIGTGFSEAMLEERSASLRSKVIPKPKSYYRYGETINPDVWFEATEVWEVKAADLTISPVHRAAQGIVDPGKGISLRFPRLMRVREDKNPEEASSAEMVADMYNAQKHNHKNNQDDNDED